MNRKPRIYIPKKIKIGNVIYKIVLKRGLKDEDGQEILGQIRYSDGIIELESKQSMDSMIVTLCHEVQHGKCFESNVEDLIKEKSLETIVDSLAKADIQVIRDNPCYERFINQAKYQKRRKKKCLK